MTTTSAAGNGKVEHFIYVHQNTPQILVTSAPYLFSVFNSAREAADVTCRRRRSMNRIVVSRHVIVMTFHTRLRHTDTFGSAMHVSNCFCEHTDIE